MNTDLVVFYILTALAVIASSFFVIWQDGDKPKMSLILKSIASFTFVILGLVSMFMADAVQLGIIFMVIGLIASVFGDVFLAGVEFKQLNKPNVIIAGMCAFAVAQIAFYIGLVITSAFYWVSILFAVLVAVAIFFSDKMLKLDYGKTKPFAVGYTFFLALTLGQALMTMIMTGYSLFTLFILLGFIFFFASDLVLAFVYFKKDSKIWFKYLNYSLYYIAQILIAMAIFFI